MTNDISNNISLRIHNIFGVKKRDEIKTIRKLTPALAIRKQCLSCVGRAKDVRVCGGHGENPLYDACPFFKFRFGHGRPSVRIIKSFCVQCMNGDRKLVETCMTTNCPCHVYRKGKNPAFAGRGRSVEVMDAIRQKRQGLIKEISSQDRLSA